MSDYPLGPGIYRRLPADQYHAIPAASSSQLKMIEKSPKHMREAPPFSSDALEFGTAVHAAVLEPEAFEATYMVGPSDDKRTKAWKDFAAACPVTPIKPIDYARVVALRDAICAHPSASWVLSKVTETELSVLWIDEASGVLCRARIDAIAPEIGATVEIKTAADASVSGFTKAIYNFRYYRQGAFYLEGAKTLATDPGIASCLHPDGFHRHIIIAAESGVPAVNVFPVRADAIEAGQMELRPLLDLYRRCEASGEWPAVSYEYRTEMTDISLPPWSWREIDERLEAAA